jgi:hypothetical protein
LPDEICLVLLEVEIDEVVVFLAEDLKAFSCPSVNAESKCLLADSAIDGIDSLNLNCH